MRAHIVVAVDGLAASGKSTIAKAVAVELGMNYYDTGRLYRAVGQRLLELGRDGHDADVAAQVAQEIDATALRADGLNSEAVARVGSVAAGHPEVRAALLNQQRAWCQSVPDGCAGVVLDGRDIGSVVCPDADLKLYVRADLEVRAMRRAVQIGRVAHAEEIAAQLASRDERDAAIPGVQRPDAVGVVVVDTTSGSLLDILRAVAALVRARAEAPQPAARCKTRRGTTIAI